MSTSSPADLAVAFRSLPRRLQQATDADAPVAAVAAAASAIDAAVSGAAARLGAPSTVDGVAAAIEQRQPSDWNYAELGELQAHATAAARAIRTLEDSAR